MTYNSQRTTHNLERGQSMVEMLIALSIIGVSLLGILALVNRSLGLNRVNTEQYIATYLAAEGIEVVKNLFDHSYLVQPSGTNNFYGWAGSGALAPGVYEVGYKDIVLVGPGCAVPNPPDQPKVLNLFKTCNGLNFLDFLNGFYDYSGGGTPTKFKRAIIIDCPTEFSGECTAGKNLDYRVTSAVFWQSRGGEFVVQLQDHFLPWRTP